MKSFKKNIYRTSEDETFFIPCGSGALTFNGAAGIYEAIIELGSSTGIVTIPFEAISDPDRFQVEWNGNIVADSLFVGDALDGSPSGDATRAVITDTTSLPKYEWDGASFVQTNPSVAVNFTFDDIADHTGVTRANGDNLSLGGGTSSLGVLINDPSSVALASDGTGKLRFNKTASTPTIIKIRVTGAASGTLWSIPSPGVSCPI